MRAAIINAMLAVFSDKFTAWVSQIPFDFFVWFTWGSYLAIFLTALGLTLFSRKIKSASKRPFLSLTNAYTGVNLAMFLFKCELNQSIIVAVLFWVAGYIMYGALCLASKNTKKIPSAVHAPALTSLPVVQPKAVRADVPAAKNNVRLEHAVSVTDKLLSKNLGKGDRQELEKLKNTLAVLQIKGTLSPAETDILNENFNALLKMMAKYNV